MRVISGKYRSKKLLSPVGDNIRPTTDRIKESLFNILQMKIYGAAVLDLFAGSGAIGIEAISRGAAKVVFSDMCTDTVKRNLKLIRENPTVLTSDFRNAIAMLKRNGETFDFIFIDPPYQSKLADIALNEIEENHLLKEDGTIVVESDKKLEPVSDTQLTIYDIRKYGDIYLNFIKIGG